MLTRLLAWIIGLFKKKQPSRIVPTTFQAVPPWWYVALDEVNQMEFPGIDHNPRIIQYHSVTKLSAMEDETAWCAAFVCWCLEESDIISPRSAWSKSFMAWGREVKTPYLGCIAVFNRGKNNQLGHVGFYAGENDEGLKILSGNQDNQVCIKTYSRAKLLGYREPKTKG